MKKFIAIVALLCAVMVSSTASAADWVWICSNTYYTVYVDNNSIRRDYNYSGYVFRAFIKWIWSRSYWENIARSKEETLPEEFNELSYSINLDYYKEENGIKYCANVNSVGYNSDGEVIPKMVFSNGTLKWSIIPPDSVGERIFDVIRARVPN